MCHICSKLEHTAKLHQNQGRSQHQEVSSTPMTKVRKLIVVSWDLLCSIQNKILKDIVNCISHHMCFANEIFTQVFDYTFVSSSRSCLIKKSKCKSIFPIWRRNKNLKSPFKIHLLEGSNWSTSWFNQVLTQCISHCVLPRPATDSAIRYIGHNTKQQQPCCGRHNMQWHAPKTYHVQLCEGIPVQCIGWAG